MPRMSVDLPAPLGPSRPRHARSWTSSEIPATAVSSPNRFTTESIRNGRRDKIGRPLSDRTLKRGAKFHAHGRKRWPATRMSARQGRKSRPPYRRLDPLKASPQARLPAPQAVLLHGVSRAEGPLQQTTNNDGLSQPENHISLGKRVLRNGLELLKFRLHGSVDIQRRFVFVECQIPQVLPGVETRK